jgi:hypothetical protein
VIDPTLRGSTQGSPYSIGSHSRGPHSRKPPLKGAHTQRIEALLSGDPLLESVFAWGSSFVGAHLLVGALGRCPSRPCLNAALKGRPYSIDSLKCLRGPTLLCPAGRAACGRLLPFWTPICVEGKMVGRRLGKTLKLRLF